MNNRLLDAQAALMAAQRRNYHTRYNANTKRKFEKIHKSITARNTSRNADSALEVLKTALPLLVVGHPRVRHVDVYTHAIGHGNNAHSRVPGIRYRGEILTVDYENDTFEVWSEGHEGAVASVKTVAGVMAFFKRLVDKEFHIIESISLHTHNGFHNGFYDREMCTLFSNEPGVPNRQTETMARKYSAARTIQRAFLSRMYDPNHPLGKKMLARKATSWNRFK